MRIENMSENVDNKKESGKEKQEKFSYSHMTDDEIKRIAEDMYRGLIFTDRHIRNPEDINSVFMPLALLGGEQFEEFKKNPPGMIYEYIDKAGNMAINGMPIFMSFRMVSQEDAKKIFEKYDQIVEIVKKI